MERMGVWVNAVSGIGVVIGLVFLAIELNQNSEVMRYQSARESAATAVDINIASMDPDVANALAKAYRDQSELTDAELVIVDSYISSYMGLFQQDFLEYRAGIQPDDWWTVRERGIRLVLSTNWTRQIWSNYSSGDFLPEFYMEVTRIIDGVPTRDYYERVAPQRKQ